MDLMVSSRLPLHLLNSVTPLLHNLDYSEIRVARWPVFHRPGRYFTGNLVEAGKKLVF